ncbi:MAG: hypothetical protein LC754_02510 [Acidobacteria bacterium]|nr:hypothetical protein [Acidobacteriota bacterium]
MLKIIHRICAYLLVALGVVHVLFTFCAYERLTPGAVWFAGAGLALVFVGFLNIAHGRGAGRDRVVRVLSHVANLLCLALGVSSVVVVQEPQAYFGLLLIALLTLTAYGLESGAGVRS